MYTGTKQKRKVGGYYFRNKHTYCPVSGLITGTYSISYDVMCQSLVEYRQENVPVVAQLPPQALLFKTSPPLPDRVAIMGDIVYFLNDCTYLWLSVRRLCELTLLMCALEELR